MDPTTGNESDDALLEELREALRAERTTPEQLMEAARAAFDWRHLDEELELLTLSYDSSLQETAGVRGPAVDAPGCWSSTATASPSSSSWARRC